jgi:hypothetical protein
MNYLKTITFTAVILFTSASIAITLAQANSSTSINATVRISVCGDGIVEGSEDCEGSDLNSKSCDSLGYSGGSLTCDISCSFDTTSCIVPPPTPTPTKAPTPTPDPNTEEESSEKTTSQQQSLASPTTTPAAGLPAFFNTQPRRVFPPKLASFDLNGDGRFNDFELRESLGIWVVQWKNFINNLGVDEEEQSLLDEDKICDLNNDQYCDLIDLSVLLYYVGR